jgi:hypothetical protein
VAEGVEEEAVGWKDESTTGERSSPTDEDGGRAGRQGPSQALRRGVVRQGTTPPPTPHLHHCARGPFEACRSRASKIGSNPHTL